jgi:hypothetical protein
LCSPFVGHKLILFSLVFFTVQPWIQRHWRTGAYYVGVGAIISIQRWLKIQVTQDTIILVVILLVPFVFRRLSKIEAGGMKFELRELRNEVIETKHEIRREVAEVRESYNALNDRLTSIAFSAADYLRPQDMGAAEQKMSTLRKSVKLSEEEIVQGLQSTLPEWRVPAYAELQLRPRRELLRPLLDCYGREKELAEGGTRSPPRKRKGGMQDAQNVFSFTSLMRMTGIARSQRSTIARYHYAKNPPRFRSHHGSGRAVGLHQRRASTGYL